MIPKEGAVLFFDMLAIPKDAPHPKNAHLFINYMLRPEVSARNSSTVHFANEQRGRLRPYRPGHLQRSRNLSGAGDHGASDCQPAALAGLHAPAEPHVDPSQDRPIR